MLYHVILNQSKRKSMRRLFTLLFIFHTAVTFAQCPPNIGFEAGNFDNWECSIGSISSSTGDITLNPTGPINGRHSLFQTNSFQVTDPFGNFPVNCPNGSNFSIQIGNSSIGRQAERVSYTFTIPANDNNYSIIYNYAVVFQNPGHNDWEQPKFTANVFDVSNNSYIGCSSFSYTASSNLPGFKLSGLRDSVFYKPWTPVTIKLSGYAGRTIRLEFTTNDCTRGGHFGYAYVDVNQNCSSPISGNIQCTGDTAQTLTAPFGFSGYRWFNADFSKLLSNEITLSMAPVPTPGNVFAVEVTPFPDQGCIDTVYTIITYSSEILDLKVPVTPVQSCVTTPVDLTAKFFTSGSSPGLSFDYFSDPGLINYVPAPSKITSGGVYYIKATNSAGCVNAKPVTIILDDFPTFKVTDPTPVTRPGTVDLFSFVSGNTSDIRFTYWKDSLTTIPVNTPNAIGQNGVYYIKGTTTGGCTVVTAVKVVINEALIIPPNAFSPNSDGIHDEWLIPLLSLYPDCLVEVYNRLGQQLFRSVGYNRPWDGKYNGLIQPVGTYYYIIKPRADLPAVGGSVTIVR